MRILLGTITTIGMLVSYFGVVVYGILWWDRIRIDFPYLGDEYLKFFIYLTLTWGIPALFIVLMFFSVLFDCCKQGNLVSSFASGIGLICLVGGLIGVTPFFLSRSTKARCDVMWNSTRKELPDKIQHKLTEYLDQHTKNMTPEQKEKFIQKFNTIDYRCHEPRKFFTYFPLMQIGVVVLEFFVMGFETCK